MNVDELRTARRGGSQKRIASVYGGRQRGNDCGRRDRSAAGAGRVCQDEGLWFHVDAAWGGAAILSPKLTALPRRNRRGGLDHLRRAQVVFRSDGVRECSSAAIARRVAQAFRADGLLHAGEDRPGARCGDTFDPFTTSMQWSRRFIGLKLFMALAEHGEAGYAGMIEHQTRMGEVLRETLKASGWRIVNSTPLPLVCFTRDGLDIRRSCWRRCASARLRGCRRRSIGGVPVMRACITSFRTTEKDIEWVVGEMNGLVASKTPNQLAERKYGWRR